MRLWITSAFRSLRIYNYRLWAAGALVSNVGTWMQTIAQDWLILTELTDNKASAVGIAMGLQFAPQLLLLPWTGSAADRFDQRKLMIMTQLVMGTLAITLGLLTVTGLVKLWHVYVFAFLFGSAAAFDAPSRQTFVADLVGEKDLANAVALNSLTFNSARMIGPAIAGLVIASVGTGWAFLMNGASFGAVLISLLFLRRHELTSSPRAQRSKNGFREGLAYVWARPDLRALMIMLFVMGTFGMNFAIFISTMAVRVFQTGAHGFGILSSMMAIGTITGGLLAAGRDRPYFSHLLMGTAIFGLGCTLAAFAPTFWLFGAALALIGVASLTFLQGSSAMMQLSSDPVMRGRVMALRMAIAMGGTPIGAPIVGWIADHFGPRWAVGVGAAAGVTATLIGLRHVLRRGEPAKPSSAVPALEADEELT
jgi:MFS family permease